VIFRPEAARRAAFSLRSCGALWWTLLVKLQEAGLLVCGYTDDVTAVVRGSFLSTLKELMHKALKIIQNWCQAKGLMVNPSKRL